MVMDDMNRFTASTLEKILLARALVDDEADIYILDSPFCRIDDTVSLNVDEMLR
jgi:ABC-type Mn2+/Zn2+ transport system ATPase subunit